MDEHDIPAGSFVDDSGVVTVDDTDIAAEIQAAVAQKHSLLIQAVTDNQITQEYANLLDSMHSSTTSLGLADIQKVTAALQLRETLQQSFSSGTVAYIGSGTDWEFPVALGAREIDMVDEMYIDEANVTNLLTTIQATNPDAILHAENVPTISFSVNLGQGTEQIRLHLVGTDVKEYHPKTQLTGVLEFAGPTKGYTTDSPVLPNIAKALAPHAPVANFDFHPQPSVPGFQTQQVGDFTLYQAA